MLFDDREMRKEMRVEVRYEFFMEVGRAAALEACWWDICQTEFVCVWSRPNSLRRKPPHVIVIGNRPRWDRVDLEV